MLTPLPRTRRALHFGPSSPRDLDQAIAPPQKSEQGERPTALPSRSGFRNPIPPSRAPARLLRDKPRFRRRCGGSAEGREPRRLCSDPAGKSCDTRERSWARLQGMAVLTAGAELSCS
ncbi:unnamed protein product [Urochloa humidicola]